MRPSSWALLVLASTTLLACKSHPASPGPAGDAGSRTNCPSGDHSADRIRVLLEAGRLLRARDLAELARSRCLSPAVDDLAAQVRLALKTERRPEELLEEVGTARNAGDLVRTRRFASQAVAALEAKLGAKSETTLTSWIGELLGSAWSEDSRRLVAWSRSIAVVFDATSGQELFRVSAPQAKSLIDGALSADGRWMVLTSRDAASNDRQLELYELAAKSREPRFAKNTAWLGRSWVFSNDGNELFWLESRGAGEDRRLLLNATELARGAIRLSLEVQSARSQSVPTDQGIALSPDGQIVVVALTGQISFVETATGRLQRFEQATETSPVIFSRTGEQAAFSTQSGIALFRRGKDSVRLLRDSRCTGALPLVPGWGAGTFSANERLLATPTHGRVCLWNVETGKLGSVIPPNTPGVEDAMPATPLEWMNDDRGLVLVEGDGSTSLWDVVRRRKVLSMVIEQSATTAAQLVLEAGSAEAERVSVTAVRPDWTLNRTVLDRCSFESSEPTSRPHLLVLGSRAIVGCRPEPALLDLADGSIRRLALPSWKSLDSSEDGTTLAVRTRFGLTLYATGSDARKTTLLADTEDVLNATGASSFAMTAESLEIGIADPNNRLHRRSIGFGADRLTISQSEIVPAPCADATPSNGYARILNSKFTWTQLTEPRGIVLCDLASGRELGRLLEEERIKVLAASDDGSKVVVSTGNLAWLWYPAQSRKEPLPKEVGLNCVFDQDTLVCARLYGLGPGEVTVFDASTAKVRASWQLPKATGRLLAVNASRGLAGVAREGVVDLLRMNDGKLLGSLPVDSAKSHAAFGSSGLLAVHSGNHTVFWRVPALERVGELLVYGSEVAFIGADGGFETSDPPERWRSRLRCTIKDYTIPLEACVEANNAPGALRQLLSAP